MKEKYKSTGLLFSLLVLMIGCLTNSFGQLVGDNQADSAAIRNTAMDYIDGYFSGDAEKVERAIHPDLNKATPRDLPQTGRTTMNYTTWSALIEFTRAKIGFLDDTARQIQVEILNIENDVSNVKVISSQFIDFLQVAKLDGEWKIVNVLFTNGSKNPPRLRNFNPEEEKPAVEKTVMNYLNGLTACDAGKLELSLDPEFNKVLLQPIAQTGKTAIRRLRYESVIENARAGIGKQDEIYRNNKVKVLAMADGIAIVRSETTGLVEQLQLY